MKVLHWKYHTPFSLSQNSRTSFSPFDFYYSSFASGLKGRLFVVFVRGSFMRDNPSIIEEVTGGSEVKKVEVDVVVLWQIVDYIAFKKCHY